MNIQNMKIADIRPYEKNPLQQPLSLPTPFTLIELLVA